MRTIHRRTEQRQQHQREQQRHKAPVLVQPLAHQDETHHDGAKPDERGGGKVVEDAEVAKEHEGAADRIAEKIAD